jgi:hypothetical protein
MKPIIKTGYRKSMITAGRELLTLLWDSAAWWRQKQFFKEHRD